MSTSKIASASTVVSWGGRRPVASDRLDEVEVGVRGLGDGERHLDHAHRVDLVLGVALVLELLRLADVEALEAGKAEVAQELVEHRALRDRALGRDRDLDVVEGAAVAGEKGDERHAPGERTARTRRRRAWAGDMHRDGLSRGQRERRRGSDHHARSPLHAGSVGQRWADRARSALFSIRRSLRMASCPRLGVRSASASGMLRYVFHREPAAPLPRSRSSLASFSPTRS